MSQRPLPPSLERTVGRLAARVDALEKRLVNPVPALESTDDWTDPFDGQFVLANNGYERRTPYYRADDEWHRFVGRVPWVLLGGNMNGQTIPGDNSEYYPPLTGLLVSPLNGGGTIDESVFGGIDEDEDPVELLTGGSSNEPFTAIELRSPGLYLVETNLGWFTDWGPVRINSYFPHSDIDFSVLTHRILLNSTENTYFGIAPPTTLAGSESDAIQYLISYHTIVSVDERATDVLVTPFVVNASGDDHTYNNTDRQGGFGLAIYQLTSSGNSNP